MSSKLTVLVTGANGFVGSNVLKSLSQNPSIQPIAACRNRHKIPINFTGNVREGDLTDPAYTEMLVRNVDVICHCAAWTALWNHEKASHKYFYEPTRKLLETAKRHGVKKVIFPSTVSANPAGSGSPNSPGKMVSFWPHLNNVIRIENLLKEMSDDQFQTLVMRLGLFIGENYSLGLLPILLPRLKTHLVPWINHGKTHLPLIDGRDIGRAFAKASALNHPPNNFDIYTIVGKTQPSFSEVIQFIHDEFGYPKPHFNVGFSVAYAFAWLMEKLDVMVPWEPLVTRSIVHLLEETYATNDKAHKELGYTPQYDWKDSMSKQIMDIQRSTTRMSMTKSL
ncbi:MAG: NAD(P)-dependent oxidoreductase [Thiotrichales bacterium]|nr:NAD(P)-dependent oxidoreductase [Thiotrichales bacterium]